MIEITDSPNVKQWGEFVYNHPHGNIFQTPEMAEVYKRTKNYEPITLAAVDSNTEEILAVLQAVVIKEMDGILGSFSARSVIQGGPIFIEDENGIKVLKLLMEHYNKVAQKKVIYTQIRTMWDTSSISSFLDDMDYKYEEHLNFLIDLNRPEEEIWRNLKRDKKRGVTNARKRGIIIEDVRDKNILQTFYTIIKETYKNARVPLANISLFESAFDILVQKDMAKFYLAKYEDTFIGARLATTYKNVVFDWYAGALSDYLSLSINEALVWHILKERANNGYLTFDFGGAGNPDEEYGVREFKRQFGGEMVNFGRYVKIHSPIKMKIAEKGFKIYRRFL